MSTSSITMEVVEKYLAFFFEEERRSPECYGEILRLPVFKTVLYSFCQNPSANIDMDMVKAELAKHLYTYTTFEQVVSLAMKKAEEIRNAEAERFANFELYRTQKAVEYMQKDFAELERKFKQLERKLK